MFLDLFFLKSECELNYWNYSAVFEGFLSNHQTTQIGFETEHLRFIWAQTLTLQTYGDHLAGLTCHSRRNSCREETLFYLCDESNLLSYRKACLQVQEYNSIKIWLFDKTFSWLYNRPNIKTDSIWLQDCH